jgi:hypothetical protein
MARALRNKVTTFSVELTEEETNWLVAAIQNPLHGESPQQEQRESRTHRLSIFCALTGADANG